jgi:hypothetical protein
VRHPTFGKTDGLEFINLRVGTPDTMVVAAKDRSLGLVCQYRYQGMPMHSSRLLWKPLSANGKSTKFWVGRWLQDKTVAELAPNLFKLIPSTIIKKTVAQALNYQGQADP